MICFCSSSGHLRSIPPLGLDAHRRRLSILPLWRTVRRYPLSPLHSLQWSLPRHSRQPQSWRVALQQHAIRKARPRISSLAVPSRPYTPSSGVYPATLVNLSPGELSSDNMQSGRRIRGPVRSPFPPLSRNARYNPIAQPPSRVTRDRTKKSKSSDSDDDDFQPVTPPSHETGPSRRREEIRRQQDRHLRLMITRFS